jgi:predicted restriction endonuclease
MFRNFQDPEYKKWRKSVYSRDEHTCQWPNCFSKKKINAHHIKTWAHYPALRFIVDNGITLCYQHHKMIKNMESIYESVFFKIVNSKKQK